MRNAIRKFVELGGIWVILYFISNIGLTIYTKWIMSSLEYAFPCIVTTSHIIITGLGAYIAYVAMGIQPVKRDQREEILLIFKFSILYSLNLALNNISLNFVSLSFHQIVRSMSPIFTVTLEYIFRDNVYSLSAYLSLIPIMVGVIMTTLCDYKLISFDMLGVILTFLGVLLAASKSIITNVLLKGATPFHTFELLWKLTPFCVAQCLIMGYLFGEFDKLGEYHIKHQNELASIYVKLFFNGLLAFFLNWTGFTSNKKTSPLAMNVAGNVKQALSIIIGVYIFSMDITLINYAGIVVTLLGGFWFSYISYTKKPKLKKKHSSEELVDDHDSESGSASLYSSSSSTSLSDSNV